MKTVAFKTAAFAALALVATVSSQAQAETITRERFGCQAREVTDRLFQLVAADETEAFGQLLSASLASGACRMWKPAEAVRLEGRAGSYACIAAEGAAGACYWTPASAIEKSE